MGMFDDVIVPKSYLKGLLTKDQEKLLKSNNYQTKSLENFLGKYKIHRQRLYLKEGIFSKKDDNWKRYYYHGKVNFYTSFYDKDGNAWWSEFDFFFENGVLDKKQLVKFEIEETAEEVEKREKAFEELTFRREIYHRTLKYKLFNELHLMLSRVVAQLSRCQHWLSNQTRTPKPKSSN